MKKTSFISLTVLAVMLFHAPFLFAAGTYSGGNGLSAATAYQIATPADMQEIGANPDDWDKHFILTADIDLSAYTGTSFNIIGNRGNKFIGTFDGNDYAIDNFTYIYTSNPYNSSPIGIFGCVGSDGQVQDLGVTNVNLDTREAFCYVGAIVGSNLYGNITNCYSTGSVAGRSYAGGIVGDTQAGSVANCYSACNVTGGNSHVGGLAGNSASSITNSYSTGNVSGSVHVGGLVGNNMGVVTSCYSTCLVEGGHHVGGLVGYNHIGTVTNCYSTGSVDGDWDVGGLAGANYAGSITNCYSTGSVSRTSNDIGGFVGSNNNGGTVTNSYFLESAGSDNGLGNPLSDVAMKQQASFVDWDFQYIWWIHENSSYPHLEFELPYEAGRGRSDDPFQIATAEQLNGIGANPDDWDKHFILTGDIDLGNYDGQDGRPVFNRIGTNRYSGAFTGVFDGAGHTVSNLTLNLPDASYVGLFGCVEGDNEEIKNLRLIDVNISAKNDVGGLIGWSGGTVSNCSTDGSVSGSGKWIGGLIGESSDASITSCYSTATVSGDYAVGGLVGQNEYADIASCYSNGNVIGNGSVGGLVGNSGGNNSNVTNSYSTGTVTGTDAVGGLVGYNADTSVTNSYSAAFVTGERYVGGLVGQNRNWTVSGSYFLDSAGPDNGLGNPLSDAAMKQQSSFVDWDFTTDWKMIREGEDYPRSDWQPEFAGDIAGLYGVGLEDLSSLSANWVNSPENLETLRALAQNWLEGK